MANSGESVSYAEMEARSNRLAHLFRNCGMNRLDHYAIYMENNSHYLETCEAGERAGLYYTCINSYLTGSELAYIVDNSESRILITSAAKLEVAREALKQCPKVELCIVVDGEGEGERIVGLREATRGLPKTPIADECIGTAMLYSSGTTGRPKGILRPAARTTADAAAADLRLPAKTLAVPRRHDLSVAGAAVSFGAVGRGQSRDPDGRHRHHHGELRSGKLSRAGREMGRDPQPAGADDVLAHAEAAGDRATPL
jgi:acyl-CoA synthetase (AMP-forming)/AMP-acid ligase II